MPVVSLTALGAPFCRVRGHLLRFFLDCDDVPSVAAASLDVPAAAAAPLVVAGAASSPAGARV